MADELTEIRALLVQRVHAGPSSSLPLIPQNGGAFSGRDFIVEDIVHRMCNSERPRIAILGQGGIGKTSVAYAVMNSPQVVEHFHTKRFWVPCVQANSPSRLLDIMVKNLNITQNTSDALQDIISELNATPAPRAILFDNFETAWDQEQQSEVQRILRSLDAVSHLSILLTMRSKTPPATDINWHTEQLFPLDAEMARLVYVKIHAKAEADIALDALLLELGYVPLAITLMATLGTASGFMPTDLLETWKHEGTNMLSHSLDPNRSMNRSIGLSVNSPLMKAYPHALSVLTTLAMLPGGADRTLLVQIFPLSTNIAGAVAAITQSALAEDRPATGSIHVHSLIRTYMLTYHPLDDETRGLVHQAFYQILSEHTSKPGDAKFSEDVRALATHESNIYTILLDAARNGGNQVVLDALLSFSWYQCWTRPNKETIDYTVQLARDAQSKRHLAEGLLCRGQIYQQLDCYPDAAIAIKEARQLFLEVDDRRRAAECLLKLGEAYSYQLLLDLYGEAVRLAQKEFQILGDKLGIAESLRYVGMYLWKTRQILAAQQALDNSRQQFEDLRHPLGIAHCRAWSSRVYLELKQYPEACDAALDALPVFRNLGDKDAIVRCLIRLTRALKPMLEGSSGSERMVIHERALKAIKEGLEVGLVQGRPLAIGQLYEELGDICRLQGTQDTAREAYQQALGYYKRISHDQGGTLRCQSNLRTIDVTEVRRNEP
jgi:tetratricopeptide (TPR) repeat protein